MNPCVDYQSRRPPQLHRKAPKLRIGVLIKSHLFGEIFGVKTPPFRESSEREVALKIGNLTELSSERTLQMMTRHTLVECERLQISFRHGAHVIKIGVVNARSRAIHRRPLVKGFAGTLLTKCLHPLYRQLRLWEHAKIVRQPRRHGVDRAPCRL